MRITPGFFHALALVGFTGLFALLMLWPTVLSPASGFPTALILLASVTPILLPMRGLLNKRPKACAWAAYISLIYFIHGSIEAYVNAAQRPYALLETLFSLLLFFGAAFYLRGLKKAA
jgi:uncharacterized membrane protein